MLHFFREARLVWRSVEETNEELLRAVTPEDNLSPRERLDKKFRDDQESVGNRIKGTQRKWTAWLGSRFSADDADRKSVDATITKIAQERAKAARSEIETNVRNAERALYDRSVSAANSLTILEAKQRVCDDAIQQLSEEVEAKRDLQQRYIDALGEVGKLGKKHTDVPALKRIEMKMKLVREIRTETDKKIEERMNEKEIQRIGRAHDNLKSFLLDADPSLAPRLDRMLLDNAAGVNDDLKKAIKAMKSVDATERAMLLDYAAYLRLGTFSRGKNRLVREFYQSSVNASLALNPDALKDRLALLYEKAPIGQGVLIVTDGGVNLNLGVMRKEGKDGKKVVLVNKAGKQVAVIDTQNKVLTVAGGVRGNEFAHYAIDEEALKGKQFDPTHIRFRATRKEVSRSRKAAA